MDQPVKEKKPDGFLDIPFNFSQIDRYVIRRAILHALNEALPMFRGSLLDIGCGAQPYRSMIEIQSKINAYKGLDLEGGRSYPGEKKPDEYWDGNQIPFTDGSFQTIIATEVMEHVDYPDRFLNEVYRVLETGGLFFFTVPFLWNLHEVPNDAYRYTPFRMEKHLAVNGFREIEVRAGGGWHASLAMMLGLWVKRAPLSISKRRILVRIIKPLMAYLLKKDLRPVAPFREGLMITNLYGWARK
jgi:SAM-dependent methyltransferase